MSDCGRGVRQIAMAIEAMSTTVPSPEVNYGVVTAFKHTPSLVQ